MRRIKIVDSNPDITQGSRADQYWKRKGWDKYYKEVRPGMELPKTLQTNDPDALVKKFNLSGIGFGNWLSVEDRINYMHSLVFAFYDLNRVIRFNFNMGLGLLGVTFGARGRGRALAHYEPGTNIINITRYTDAWYSKYIRFFSTGGVGSFAHEYGHFFRLFRGCLSR